MFEWMEEVYAKLRQLSWTEALLISLVLFLVGFFGSLALVGWVLVKLPVAYFQEDHPRAFLWAERHPFLRGLGFVGKNMLGVLLVLVGIVLSLPGVPGQGILTILIGIMLLDFPGKRRLERKLVSRPSVLKAINRLRHRFDKPPLELAKK